jgi:hypothetical protein
MRTLPALLLLGTVVFAQQAPPAPAPITYDDAVANEKRLFAADQEHDMDTIAAIVADEFVDIARDGSWIGKPALLKEIPNIKLVSYKQQNFRVTALGPYAYVISYDSDATMIGADGKQSRNQNALNSVWVKRDGRWQMVVHSRGEASSMSAK